MSADIYELPDTDGEERSREKTDECIYANEDFHRKHRPATMTTSLERPKHDGHYKWAVVCLGLLCVVLVAITIGLHYKTASQAAENKELKTRLYNLMKQITCFAVNVTLDPDTANERLLLSADGKQVRRTNSLQKVPDNPKRFKTVSSVLANQSFTSGRFYYEVKVSGNTGWSLGIARESIDRKGSIQLSPKNGYWAIWLRDEEYKALTKPPVVLDLEEKPERVGVFVDYEAGLVSFYDADRWNQLYLFRGVSFIETIYLYFSVATGTNSSPLSITSPAPCMK